MSAERGTRSAELTKAQAEAWAEFIRLLGLAVVAVSDLSKHLEETGDLQRMYKANSALHTLWKIE